MDPTRNPYSPGAGSPPPALVGRDAELRAMRIAMARLLRGRFSRSVVLTGLRGVGKTVLLQEFRRLGQGMEWVCLPFEASEDMRFPQAMAEVVRKLLLRLSPARDFADRAFFRVRIDRTTDLERGYLVAMASLGRGPHASGRVAAAMGRDTSGVGPVRDRLIRKGLCYSPRWGEVDFTVPLFDDFVRRWLRA